jgi:hypothetical protein
VTGRSRQKSTVCALVRNADRRDAGVNWRHDGGQQSEKSCPVKTTLSTPAR